MKGAVPTEIPSVGLRTLSEVIGERISRGRAAAMARLPWVSLVCLALHLLLTGSSASPGLRLNSRISARRASLRDAQESATTDPCSVLHTKLVRYYRDSQGALDSPYAFARPTQVARCTQAVPFDASRELSTLRSVALILESFYSLLHVARSSPDPRLPSQYHVLQQLRALGRQNWTDAETFYASVATAVNHLDDGHTQLRLGCPPFNHVLALPLVGVVENGSTTVRVAPQRMMDPVYQRLATQHPFSFNAQAYAGARVESIEGRPAWPFMQRWAQVSAGKFRNPGQKLNWAFAHLKWNNGTRGLHPGAFSSRSRNPGRDSVAMTLVRSEGGKAESVLVPWMSLTPAYGVKGFRNTSTYYRAFCAAPRKGSAKPEGQPRGVEAGQEGRQLNLALGMAPSRPARFRLHEQGQDVELPLSQGARVSGPGDFFPVYRLSDNQTAVVSLSTFAPSLPAKKPAALLEFFALETAKAFETANKSSTRVLLDVARNGGGFNIFVPWVMELFLGSGTFPVPRSSMEDPLQYLADTPLVLRLRAANAGSYDYSGFADLEGESFNESSKDAFFFPLQRQAYGPAGVPGRYSSPFTYGNPSLSEAFDSETLAPAFGSKPVALFSDGMCFSACSMFAMGLRTRFGVPLVSIGGIPGVPLGFSASGGGFATSNVEDDILASFPDREANSSSVPQPFPINANMAIRWANGFLRTPNGTMDGTAPTEFTFVGADVRINYTLENVADPSLQYLAAAQALWGDKQ